MGRPLPFERKECRQEGPPAGLTAQLQAPLLAALSLPPWLPKQVADARPFERAARRGGVFFQLSQLATYSCVYAIYSCVYIADCLLGESRVWRLPCDAVKHAE